MTYRKEVTSMFRQLDKQRRVLIGTDCMEFAGLKPGKHILYKKMNLPVAAVRQEDNVDENSEFLRYVQIDSKSRITLPKDVCQYIFGEEVPEKVNVIVKKGEIQLSLT